MTWAQATFAYCFLVLVPVTAFLFARRWKHAGKPAWKGFLAGGFLMGSAMIACSALAITVYPHYPGVPISEWIANAFTLLAVAIVLAALWWRRPSSEQKRFVVRCTVIFLAFYFAGIGFTRWATLWPYRRALPWSASDIKERFWTDILLPDYEYQLKAKITDEQFKDYIKLYRLTDSHRTYTPTEPNEKSWWNPPANTTIYSREEGDWSMGAMYGGGYIYVEAFEQ